MPAMFNLTKSFIDFFARLGWAYNLRTISPESIQRQVSLLNYKKIKINL
jgi:hypothetical protein